MSGPNPHIVGLAVAPGLRVLVPSPYRDREFIARLVHEALTATLGSGDDGSSPLSGFIRPGESVLLKPNWVFHVNRKGHGMDCLVTHEAFLEAILREVRKARPARVVIGDAPLQGCRWESLVTPILRARLEAALEGIPLSFVDFRRTVMKSENLASGVESDRGGKGRHVLFDLAAESLLEPVSRPPGRFRVTMYDPQRLAESHRPGRHRYLVCREIFEADVVINLPKIKTHRKSGITAALKNLVGINGNKDFLPHHRTGGADSGGDCYPGDHVLKRLAEHLLDRANARIGRPEYRLWRRLSSIALDANSAIGLTRDVLAKRVSVEFDALRQRRLVLADLEAGWYGNDTVWRTCLDLNRILLYGRADGTMSVEPLRRVLNICDGIVAGQGEGPLSSEPLALGAIVCGTSAAAVDLVNCGLLGLNWHRIPLVREAFGAFRWPLPCNPSRIRVQVGAELLEPAQVAERFGSRATVPVGWAGHCELDSSATERD